MPGPKLAVVIATCRPGAFKKWFEEWKHELRDAHVFVVEDQPEKTGDLGFIGVIKNWHHYSWREIDGDLGDKSWIIPRRTSAIKSYGFLKAKQSGADYIWTLDDDCFPEERPYSFTDYPGEMIARLTADYSDDSWHNTIASTMLYPRGYPYGIRQDTQPVMIHHGLWSGVPDLDGITALEHHRLRLEPAKSIERVPTGRFFAMCGMNLAFRAEVAPAMYFGLQGRIFKDTIASDADGTLPLPFDRFDDIWAGLFAKKVADHLGYAVTSGAPSIIHTKLSDPTQRVIKEGPGIAANEILWKVIADYKVPAWATTVKLCYTQLAGAVECAASDLPFPDYWKKLADAMQTWTEFF